MLCKMQADDVWMRASDPHHLAFLFLFNDTVRYPVQESCVCVCVMFLHYSCARRPKATEIYVVVFHLIDIIIRLSSAVNYLCLVLFCG